MAFLTFSVIRRKNRIFSLLKYNTASIKKYEVNQDKSESLYPITITTIVHPVKKYWFILITIIILAYYFAGKFWLNMNSSIETTTHTAANNNNNEIEQYTSTREKIQGNNTTKIKAEPEIAYNIEIPIRNIVIKGMLIDEHENLKSGNCQIQAFIFDVLNDKVELVEPLSNSNIRTTNGYFELNLSYPNDKNK
ncbi:MAG: hypothetical protein HY606_15710, partial [Planctomycetes bacterium]|nr:hypothetical protein [Planctomycetota bacterium]